MSITWELTPGGPPRQMDDETRARSLSPRRIALLAGLAAAGLVMGVSVGVAVSRDDAVLSETPAIETPALETPAQPAAAPRRVDAAMTAQAGSPGQGGVSMSVADSQSVAPAAPAATPPALPTRSARFQVDASGADAAGKADPDRIELVVDGATVNPLLREKAGSGVDTVSAFAEDGPPVAVAETDAETRAMENAMADGGVKEFAGSAAQTEVAAAPKPAAPADVSTDGLGRAVTTKAVNLRSGPDNGASVVAVIPAGASILAPASCKFWCRTVYDGQSGYIFKSFVRR